MLRSLRSRPNRQTCLDANRIEHVEGRPVRGPCGGHQNERTAIGILTDFEDTDEFKTEASGQGDACSSELAPVARRKSNRQSNDHMLGALPTAPLDPWLHPTQRHVTAPSSNVVGSLFGIWLTGFVCNALYVYDWSLYPSDLTMHPCDLVMHPCDLVI